MQQYRDVRSRHSASQNGTQSHCVAPEATKRLVGSSVSAMASQVQWPPSRIQFDYLDVNGAFTSRRVDVEFMLIDTFTGYCRDREDTRTFRYDRIVGDVVDRKTGELLNVEDWRAAGAEA